MINEVWLSNGSNGKVEGFNYASPVSTAQAFIIHLYAMFFRSPVDIRHQYCTASRVKPVLSINGFCMVNRGAKSIFKISIALPPSPYTNQYFNLAKHVFVTDNTDTCTVAAKANAMGLIYVA